MTREIRVNERTFQREPASAHITTSSNVSAFARIGSAYKKAVRIKRNISDTFVAITEVLADKTAREGLFGEDRDKNYCGTSVDYISD